MSDAHPEAKARGQVESQSGENSTHIRDIIDLGSGTSTTHGRSGSGSLASTVMEPPPRYRESFARARGPTIGSSDAPPPVISESPLGASSANTPESPGNDIRRGRQTRRARASKRSGSTESAGRRGAGRQHRDAAKRPGRRATRGSVGSALALGLATGKGASTTGASSSGVQSSSTVATREYSRSRALTPPDEYDEELTIRIWCKLRSEVPIADHKAGFTTHKGSVWGRELISWLSSNEVSSSEANACGLATLMICRGLLASVDGITHLAKDRLYIFIDSRETENRVRSVESTLEKVAGSGPTTRLRDDSGLEALSAHRGPKVTASRIRSKWFEYDTARALNAKMCSDLLRPSALKSFFRKKNHCFSGSEIINWLRASTECPQVRTREQAYLLATLLLLHRLIEEVITTDEMYQMHPELLYRRVPHHSKKLSMIDNPMINGLPEENQGKGLKERKNTRVRLLLGPSVKARLGIQGWLERRGMFGTWKRRYWRLIMSDRKLGTHLAQFNSEAKDAESKGVLLLSQADSMRQFGRVLQIKTLEEGSLLGHKTKTTLRCKTEAETSKWVGALRPFIKPGTATGVLRQSAFGFALTQAQVERLGSQTSLTMYKKNDALVVQGQVSTKLILLQSGRVRVCVNRRDSSPSSKKESGATERILTWQTPTAHFGEEIFEQRVMQSPVTVRAEGAVRAFELQRSAVASAFRTEPELQGKLVSFVNGAINVMKKVKFLSSLSTVKLDLLRRASQIHSLEAEQVVFYEGDQGDKFYIILQGSVAVIQRDNVTRENVQIATLSSGDYFGEVSLIVGIMRTATIVAQKRSLLLSIDKTTFKNFLTHEGLDLGSVMRTRVIDTFKGFKIPFFAAIPREQYPQLSNSCRIESLRQGDVICRQGDTGKRFYIIVYGMVNIIVDGTHVTTLGSGKYFGEVALVVDGARRTATCTAGVDTILLSMSAEDFRGMFDTNPQALADLELKIAGRSCGVRAVLHHPIALRAFCRFCETQYATESINAWKRVNAFRWKYSKAEEEAAEAGMDAVPEALREEAAAIANNYIRVGSSEEINIKATMREECLREIDEGRIHANIFYRIENELVLLLRNDKLRGFLRTEDFTEVLTFVGYNKNKNFVRSRNSSGCGKNLTKAGTLRKMSQTQRKTLDTKERNRIANIEISLQSKRQRSSMSSVSTGTGEAKSRRSSLGVTAALAPDREPRGSEITPVD